MHIQEKKDYLSPACLPLELSAESLVCDSADQTLDLNMEGMLEEPFTWII